MNSVRPALYLIGRTAMAAARPGIDRIVRDLVPASADFCLVHLASSGTIRAITGAHATRDGARVLRLLMRSYRIAPDDAASGVASVMRTLRPLLRTAIQMDTAVARRGYASAVELHRQLAPRSALVLPVLSPVGAIGAITLCYSQSGRTYSARDIRTAERVAARIAQMLVPPIGDPRRAPSGTGREGPAARRRVTSRR